MKIAKHERRADGIWLGTDSGQIHIQACGDDIIRVRYTREAGFSTTPSLMVESPPLPSALDVCEADGTLTLTTTRLALRIEMAGGRFTWCDAAGNLLTRQPQRDGMRLDPMPVQRAILGDVSTERGVDGERSKAGEVRWETIGSAWQTRLAFEFQPGEAIYGLGQHDQGNLNYRGRQEFLYQQNMKVAMPMIVSTRGWGVLWDSYSLAAFHDDAGGSFFWTDTDDELEFYFMYGPSLDGVVGACRRLTGKAVLLPRWALGYVQSKERYCTQQELVDVVAEYRRRGLPLDVIVQDWRTWPDGMWGEKQFDPARFPDPSRLTADLHAMHAKLMVSIWPVMSGGPNAAEMQAAGCMLETAAGAPTGATYDAFDPAARALYWKQAREAYWKHGIDAWWCDCTEPFEADWRGEVKPEPQEQMRINVQEFKKLIGPDRINAYSLQHSRGLYENQLAESPDRRMLNLTRSAYVGQQRYGTVTWSGDVAARWDVLAGQIPAGLNFCMTGCPWWTTDIGAFFVRRDPSLWFWNGDYDGGVADPGYRELYVRWFQYGTFLPMFRSHGTDTPREVWRFGEPGDMFHDTLVRFLHLRYRLLPYLYTLAGWTYHRDYTPMRALAFDFPDDPAVHDLKDQFMYGPALMVCPVITPMYYAAGAKPLCDAPRRRSVYLPAGADWYDFWTGRRHSGGQTILADAPLDIIPLFVRSGSILPLGPVMQYADEKPDAPWEIRIYPGRDGAFDLYEDDGDGLQYRDGACAWTPFKWDDSERRLRVGARTGTFRSLVPRRQLRLVVAAGGIGEAPGTVMDYTGVAAESSLAKG
ncbi:MAG: TIM-barrel domain-containing protein [bacterium]